MLKNIFIGLLAVFLLFNLCGCVALLAGGAVGATGTAVWLSGKLVQRVDYPFEKTVQAVKDGLRSLGYPVLIKENLTKGFAQIRSRNEERQKVWVDVFKITENTSQIQVRVGVNNKNAADKVLRAITQSF